MELFLDRAHLRLRSREDDTYHHADEDGWGVSGSPHRASLNTAWVVHLLRHVGATYVLLHGAAYGRYLALRYQPQLAPPQMQPQGHHLDYRTIQRVYDTPVQADVMWELRPAGDGSGDVRLRHAMYHAFVMPLWIVEAIPARQLPPDLPQQVPNGVEHPVVLRRLIRYVRVDNSGIFNLPWRTFMLDGRSVVDLIGELVVILNVNYNEIRLCVRAGLYGRLTPLVINLPDSEETMDIVIFTTGSPAALELRHPDVDAE
nr:unnamed protein product [Digitaria exilis]